MLLLLYSHAYSFDATLSSFQNPYRIYAWESFQFQHFRVGRGRISVGSGTSSLHYEEQWLTSP